MKNIYTLATLLILSLSSFAKTYYTYTAKKSGHWDNAATWSMVVRNDNVSKDKFIIPSSLTVIADDDVNSMGYSDVELQISGTLELGASVSLYFGVNSKIEIFTNGAIDGEGASQQIYIGGESKYIGNSNKTLNGPVYADFSTGSAPTGFKAYSMLSVNFISFTASKNHDNSVSIKWSTSDDKNNNHFDVEQSINGNAWTKVGSVNAIINNSAIKVYSFNHTNSANGFISYRLKQVDNDGKHQYSTVVAIRQQDAQASANIFASNKNITIEFSSEVKSVVGIKILNMFGDVVASQSINNPSSKFTLNMSQLNNGFYIVHVTGNNNSTVKKVSLN